MNAVLCLAVLLLQAAPAPADNEKGVALAITRAKKIARAVEQFYENNGELPAALRDLAWTQPNSGPPLLREADLLDPWKKPYQYDPQGPKNGSKAVDVWTVAPARRRSGTGCG
jgi:hypothetical protein